jgi:hypothetical protein
VTVEGHPLEIYGVKQEGSRTIAYIEAFDGKGFSVEFSDQRTRYQVPTSFNMSLAVDGAPYVLFSFLKRDPLTRRPCAAFNALFTTAFCLISMLRWAPSRAGRGSPGSERHRYVSLPY